MEAEERQQRAASFGAVASVYADNRPGYPAEAVGWLAGSRAARVLELGCGTGKLTAGLVSLGHDVVATDPSVRMLAHLRPSRSVHLAAGRAEDIPLRAATVDVVTAGQAFHWFDADRALPEVARVLRPGGVLALTWNGADFTVPWVRRVFALIDAPNLDEVEDPVAGSDLFSASDAKVFRHWQPFDKATLVGFISSSSRAATMSATEHDDLLAAVGAIYDSYGRGPDGMLMPWKTHCYRARVTGLAAAQRETAGEDDDGLLVDFS
jgi:SAM-dependent methyltransferase